MARTRKTSREALEEKIEKAEADVIAAKKKYDQATANLKELLDKKTGWNAGSKSRFQQKDAASFLSGRILCQCIYWRLKDASKKIAQCFNEAKRKSIAYYLKEGEI